MSTDQMMISRISRANLDDTKKYIKVQKVGGVVVEEEVGRFVKSYYMGSGDGRTLHWEFELNGIVRRIDDQMWGSINGEELEGFIAVIPVIPVQ